MTERRPTKQPRRVSRLSNNFVICIDNDGYAASLEIRKLYRTISDRGAAEEGMIRVFDESGEDYLYPADMFRPIQLALSIRRALSSTAKKRA